MKRIFVCSAFAGDIMANITKAQEYCRRVIDEGHAPFAPHLLYPQMLDEANPADRAKGIACGLAWLEFCDEMWVFSKVSDGMQQEILEAMAHGITIRYFDGD
jgi:hypothetical protein